MGAQPNPRRQVAPADLTHAGPPFYQPPWAPTVVGMVPDGDADWDEVAELVIESYRCCAPQKLRHRLDR